MLNDSKIKYAYSGSINFDFPVTTYFKYVSDNNSVDGVRCLEKILSSLTKMNTLFSIT